MFHHRGLRETKSLVEYHRHHFGAEFHHLHQEADLPALLAQTLAQHVPPLGVKRQIVQFSLVRRAQIAEKGGDVHGLLS